MPPERPSRLRDHSTLVDVSGLQLLDPEPSVSVMHEESLENGLRHATSLEPHIVANLEMAQRFEQSYANYQKNLRFKNPLNTCQVLSILLATILAHVYPAIYAFNIYDRESCTYRETPGLGAFLNVFIVYLVLVDLQAIVMRIRIYLLMNRKDTKSDDTVGDGNEANERRAAITAGAFGD